MKYIHMNCLKSWLDSKRQERQTDTVKSYFWKNIECELCKSLFPDVVKVKNELKRILGYELPETGPYLVLETYSSLKSKSRIIHVLSFEGLAKIRVGRGQDSDVRITDISVSRNHAEIEYLNGKFLVTDMESKFGTLSSILEPIKVKKSINLQSGKTVIKLKICKPEK